MRTGNELTPVRIVTELDKYIIGQDAAKRAVAIALRNRWRRQKISGQMQQEIIPNNIILIGPTGVGKTEIARRLSKLANAPFIKVEASKFTEVGYVGRDVESMVRELMDLAINQVRSELLEENQAVAVENAHAYILDLLLPPVDLERKKGEDEEAVAERKERYLRSREKMAQKLDSGELDEREIDVKLDSKQHSPQIEVFSNTNMEMMDFNVNDIMSYIISGNSKEKSQKMKIKDALAYLTEQEAGKMISKEQIVERAKDRVENHGIIFIDEIDKIAGFGRQNGADISRSGVQRDLLPIVEGSNVPTKHGMINTAHILFIAAGAFHMTKPSDLIPELQGRFPIRVELNSLTKEDFIRILTEPENALIRQYEALFQTENVKLHFSKEAISLIADYAAQANEKMEDIGARRLHTVLNQLLDEFLYEMPNQKIKKVLVTEKMVEARLNKIIQSEDLSKYIL